MPEEKYFDKNHVQKVKEKDRDKRYFDYVKLADLKAIQNEWK